MKRTFTVTVTTYQDLPKGFNLSTEISLGIMIRLRDRHDLEASCKVTESSGIIGYSASTIIVDEFATKPTSE
jgi:hypothetical protein